jgi:hypothetical protein
VPALFVVAMGVTVSACSYAELYTMQASAYR